MATLFNVWIDSPDDSSGGNVFSQSDFASDSQRADGYESGQTISAKRLNTILRQTSLITTALMDVFCGSSTVTLTSTLANVKSALVAGIAAKAELTALSTTVNTLNTTTVPNMSTALNTVINSTIPALSDRVTYIENGAQIVPKAGSAVTDESNNNIKASYAASLTISGTILTLKSKSGATLTSATITNALDASTANYATTAGSANSATKLGSTSVGGTKKFIYLVDGVPTAASSTVGTNTKPIYMSSGTITASTANVGSNAKPVYMSSGTITASSYDLRKTMITSTLNFNSSSAYKNIMNFTKGSSYSMSTLGVSSLFSTIDGQFGSFDDGTYLIDIGYTDSTTNYYFTGSITKETSSDTYGTVTTYFVNVLSVDGDTRLIFKVASHANSTYDIVIKKVIGNLSVVPNAGQTTDMTCWNLSILAASGSSTSTQTAKGKKLSWLAY